MECIIGALIDNFEKNRNIGTLALKDIKNLLNRMSIK